MIFFCFENSTKKGKGYCMGNNIGNEKIAKLKKFKKWQRRNRKALGDRPFSSSQLG